MSWPAFGWQGQVGMIQFYCFAPVAFSSEGTWSNISLKVSPNRRNDKSPWREGHSIRKMSGDRKTVVYWLNKHSYLMVQIIDFAIMKMTDIDKSHLSCGEILKFSTWQMWRNFRFLHICHRNLKSLLMPNFSPHIPYVRYMANMRYEDSWGSPEWEVSIGY